MFISCHNFSHGIFLHNLPVKTCFHADLKERLPIPVTWHMFPSIIVLNIFFVYLFFCIQQKFFTEKNRLLFIKNSFILGTLCVPIIVSRTVCHQYLLISCVRLWKLTHTYTHTHTVTKRSTTGVYKTQFGGKINNKNGANG